MDLELTASTDADGRTVLTMAGALDLASRRELLSVSHELLSAGPVGLVLDMAGVDFIDSTGIGAMVDIGHQAEDLGVTFSIGRPSPTVLRIFEVTGLLAQWTIETDAAPT